MVMLYHVGLEIGQAVHEELRRFAKGDLAKAMMLGQELFKHVGFGTVKAELNLKECRAIVRIWDSFECGLFKNSSEPQSHLVRDMTAGFLTGFFDELMYSEETECIAKGDECCVFRVGRRGEILP